jgi:hypothetical protein
MWYSKHQKLVEHGLACFIGRISNDVMAEELVAHISILCHFKKEGYTLDNNVQAHMQCAQGHALEEAILLSCTKLFQQGVHLDQVFQFHGEMPEWAYQGALIMTQLNGGTLKVFDIPNENPVVPSADLAYFAQGSKDVEHWIKSKDAGWCLPSSYMGPNLMVWLCLDDEQLLLVLFQVKCYLNGNIHTIPAKITVGAIQSLSPKNILSKLVLFFFFFYIIY